MRKITIGFMALLLAISFSLVPPRETAHAATIKAKDLVAGNHVQLGQYKGEPLLWKVGYNPLTGFTEYGKLVESITLMAYYNVDIKAFSAIGPVDGRKWTFTDGVDAGDPYWPRSALRDWLNSTQEVVKYQGPPPDYASDAGFLYEWSEEDQSVLVPTFTKFYTSYGNPTVDNNNIGKLHFGRDSGTGSVAKDTEDGSIEKISLPAYHYSDSVLEWLSPTITGYLRSRGYSTTTLTMSSTDRYAWTKSMYYDYGTGENKYPAMYQFYPAGAAEINGWTSSSAYRYTPAYDNFVRPLVFINKNTPLVGSGTLADPYKVDSTGPKPPSVSLDISKRIYVNEGSYIALNGSASSSDDQDITLSYKIYNIATQLVVKEGTIGSGQNISFSYNVPENVIYLDRSFAYNFTDFLLKVYATSSTGIVSEDSTIISVRKKNPYEYLIPSTPPSQ